jgi:uncharacterized protein
MAPRSRSRAPTLWNSYRVTRAGPPRSPSGDFELYCDVTSRLSWDGGVVTMVDLDLDIIRTFSGETRLLDEDEFEAHRIELACPDILVEEARQVAAMLMRLVGARLAPFDGSHLP